MLKSLFLAAFLPLAAMGQTATNLPTFLTTTTGFFTTLDPMYTSLTNSRARLAASAVYEDGKNVGVDFNGALFPLKGDGWRPFGLELDTRALSGGFKYVSAAPAYEWRYGNIALRPSIGVGYDFDQTVPSLVFGLSATKMVNKYMGVFTRVTLDLDRNGNQTPRYSTGVILIPW
jgi:hypothetical protein